MDLLRVINYDTLGMGKKKEQRFAPTFVNLKSNTMKNTVQRYGFLAYLQIFGVEKCVS